MTLTAIEIDRFMVSLSNHEAGCSAVRAEAFMVRQAHHEGSIDAGRMQGALA
ncbi:hypothetical protein [Vineibacter terrae]|uniref:hypothetical protein n=1 Tax=Vineibacter terrae TaxID=2586908 RepID=UPI0015B48294|nr:hypothetical protein [Vineibacter terrae]